MWFIGVKVEQETSAPPPKKQEQSYIKLVHGRFIFRSRYNLVNHWVKLLAQRPHDEFLIHLKVLQHVNSYIHKGCH